MNMIRKAVFTLLIATGAVVTALPATALVVTPAGIVITEIDQVRVNAKGFDIAGSGQISTPLTIPAELHWEQGATGAISKLLGSIYFNNVVGICARVQLTSYDDNNNEISPRQFSQEECPNTNGLVEKVITDQLGNPYLQGNPGAAEVRVRLQNMINGSWTNLGADTEYYGPTLATSGFSMFNSKFDVGFAQYVNGRPVESAEVTWSVAGENLVKASTYGKLYMNNAANLCGRVKYEYFNKSAIVGLPDTLLATQHGHTHCANDIAAPGLPNDLQTFTINANPGTQVNAFSFAELDRVVITIEKSSYNQQTHLSNEDWVDVGTPVTIDLPPA